MHQLIFNIEVRSIYALTKLNVKLNFTGELYENSCSIDWSIANY